MADLPESLAADLFPSLTDRQRTALPIVLAAPTTGAGLDAAQVPKSTWYRWRQDPAFREALVQLQRDALRESMADLQVGSRYAVRGLLGLMTSSNEHIKLQACREVLNLSLKATELLDLEGRLGRLEAMLAPLADAAQAA